MSTELIKARSQISSVGTFLKQEHYIPAVQALHDSIITILRQPLMRNEKEEFIKLVGDAVFKLDSHPGFREMVPLKLEYTPGHEKELRQQLHALLSDLQANAVAGAQDQLKELEERRRNDLLKGQELLNRREYEQADAHFTGMLDAFPDDTALKAEIGEMYLKAGRYEQAYTYLAQALEENPESTHLYNRVGIALRKMGQFETAEKYFSRALDFVKDDPNLYFNVGRLYIDMGQWDRVAFMAEKALKYQPDFVEAKKMLTFAQKRLKS